MTPHTPAKFDLRAFNCIHCGAFADHEWFTLNGISKTRMNMNNTRFIQNIINIEVEQCNFCKEYTIWKDKTMVYPTSGNVPLPNSDMPTNVKSDYEEAKEIVNISPRGAAALLRLSVQKLCKHLGETGENINNDIKQLVKKGLPEKMQKALDSVRVIGNNAVHPGQIDLTDDIETAYKLFGFINVICDIMISQPKSIDEFYEYKVPDEIKAAIKKRDGN
jgi:hypothetical protein